MTKIISLANGNLVTSKVGAEHELVVLLKSYLDVQQTHIWPLVVVKHSWPCLKITSKHYLHQQSCLRNVAMLNVIMLGVVILSVVTPYIIHQLPIL